jgi:hypothetical protein
LINYVSSSGSTRARTSPVAIKTVLCLHIIGGLGLVSQPQPVQLLAARLQWQVLKCVVHLLSEGVALVLTGKELNARLQGCVIVQC